MTLRSYEFLVIIYFFFVFSNLFGTRAPEFDMSELESLFSASAPNSDFGKGGKLNRRSGQKTDKVQLVCLFFLLIHVQSNYFIYQRIFTVS